MISFIRGQLFEKRPTEAIVESNGIGYQVFIPVSTYEALGEPGEQVFLLTHLYVREDAMTLFGFATEDERETFRDLLSVSGIGPKLALGILSGAKITELQRNVAEGNEAALIRIRGLGRKTAQRLIVDLKEKFSRKISTLPPTEERMGRLEQRVIEEAVLALMSLGYSHAEAQKSIERVARLAEDVTVEELVRTALKG